MIFISTSQKIEIEFEKWKTMRRAWELIDWLVFVIHHYNKLYPILVLVYGKGTSFTLKLSFFMNIAVSEN